MLHDVAPATWPAYAAFVAEVDASFSIPLTLLVVPDFHRRGTIDHYPDFVAAMEQRLARGDELVLHGYHHDDPGPIPWHPRAWIQRRILTHEGEFLPLDHTEARARIDRGRALFRQLGWPVHGFVAPAWLLGSEARQALAESSFAYTSHPNALLQLPDFHPLSAPTLVWSAGSAWRRVLSLAWNHERLRRARKARLIRLGLHPVDMTHASSRHFWLRTLALLLPARHAVTKHAWLEQSS